MYYCNNTRICDRVKRGGRRGEPGERLSEFVPLPRLMILEFEHQGGKPFLLAAKLPPKGVPQPSDERNAVAAVAGKGRCELVADAALPAGSPHAAERGGSELRQAQRASRRRRKLIRRIQFIRRQHRQKPPRFVINLPSRRRMTRLGRWSFCSSHNPHTRWPLC